MFTVKLPGFGENSQEETGESAAGRAALHGFTLWGCKGGRLGCGRNVAPVRRGG